MAIGAEGRSVRCVRCRTTWFARPNDLLPMPETADVADASLEPADVAAPSLTVPKVVPWNDTVMIEVNPSPPLAPAPLQSGNAPDQQPAGESRTALRRPTSGRSRARTKASLAQRRAVAAAALAASLIITTISLRESIVRMEPDLAGLYAAFGLPVNLRGLEFSGIKMAHEMQDGIPVLVIEGEVVNVARSAVEVPRLRLAVLGPDSRELYSWTALLPRSVLPEGESLPFRSRLASPPADGKRVMVRFLNRLDLTSNTR